MANGGKASSLPFSLTNPLICEPFGSGSSALFPLPTPSGLVWQAGYARVCPKHSENATHPSQNKNEKASPSEPSNPRTTSSPCHQSDLTSTIPYR